MSRSPLEPKAGAHQTRHRTGQSSDPGTTADTSGSTGLENEPASTATPPSSLPAGVPAHDRQLPRLPRRSIAERLNNRKLLHLPYKIFNRIERRQFAETFRNQTTLSNVIVARRGYRLWIMRVDPSATNHSASRHNLNIILDLCKAHGIRYFAMQEPSSEFPRLAVPASDWTAFVDAAKSLGDSSPLYVSLEGLDTRGRVSKWSTPVSDPFYGDHLDRQSRLGFFEILTPTEQSATFYGRGQACVVEKWEADELDTWHSPTINERTRQLGATHRAPATFEYNGRWLDTFEPLNVPHLFDVDFDVDLVYLWVDGSDPAWQARKIRCLEELTGHVQPEAADTARFRDYGELRYSLRSVHEYVPWARRIFLVTDRQVPSWLNTEHPKLRVVDHEELFGSAGRLPTFNSHAIGARLHHIRGLSDNYLYMNDDVMFGRPVRENLFFHGNGMSKFFLSKATLPYHDGGQASPHEEARRNVVNFLEREFGLTATQTFFHTPVPQRRAIMDKLETNYPDAFRANWRSQFRSSDDYEMNSWLHNYYGYLQNMAMPGSIRYDYFDLSDPSIPIRMERLLQNRDKDCFCINDNADALDENQSFVGDWLNSYFPRASPFEK